MDFNELTRLRAVRRELDKVRAVGDGAKRLNWCRRELEGLIGWAETSKESSPVKRRKEQEHDQENQ